MDRGYNPLWLDSKCSGGMWLHKFRPHRTFPDGFEEVCERCGEIKYFTSNTPSEEYMRYNMRRALHPARLPAEFHVEYEN